MIQHMVRFMEPADQSICLSIGYAVIFHLSLSHPGRCRSSWSVLFDGAEHPSSIYWYDTHHQEERWVLGYTRGLVCLPIFGSLLRMFVSLLLLPDQYQQSNRVCSAVSIGRRYSRHSYSSVISSFWTGIDESSRVQFERLR